MTLPGRVRPHVALLALLGGALVAIGCGGAATQDPCADDGATDACRAEQALARFAAGDREGGLAAARAIEDPAERDLVLSAGARDSGWDLCGEIGDPALRDACEVNAGRHHLRLPGAGPDAGAGAPPAPAAPAVAAVTPDDCAALDEPLRDPCRLRAAERAVELGRAEAICAGVADADQAGECAVGVAVRRAQGGDADGAEAVCARQAAGRWRDDCFFRLAERDALAMTARRALCDRAGSFRVHCTMHLASSTANRAALAVGEVGLDAALAELEAAAEPLARELAGDALPAPAVAREFWVQALYDLLLRAAAREPLGRWRDVGARFDAGDPRATLFDDLLVMCWARAEAHRLLDAGVGVEDGWGLADWLARGEAQLWGAAVAARGGDESLVLAAADAGAVRFPAGKLPMALEPTSSCPLAGAERRAVALVWGLAPAPWPVVDGALIDALEHPSPAVRAAALELLAEMADHFHRAEPAPPGVAAALGRLAEGDGHAAVRERAGALREALADGATLPPWTIPADRLCPPSAGGHR